MTVQAGIETVTDLEAMVGELEAPACEHSEHQTRRDFHGDAPASHYIRGYCACSGYTEVYAACPKFVAWIRSGVLNCCPDCKRIALSNEVFQILAPINSTTP